MFLYTENGVILFDGEKANREGAEKTRENAKNSE
jgi:hypothetical protein